MMMKKVILGVSAVLGLFFGVSLAATFLESRIIGYIQRDIIDERWKSWNDEQKESIESKLDTALEEYAGNDHVITIFSSVLEYFRKKKSGKNYDKVWKTVIVDSGTEGRLRVRKGPNEAYEIIGYVEELTVIDVYTEMDGWFEIRFEGGSGWIAGRFTRLYTQEDAALVPVPDDEEEILKKVTISPNDLGMLRVRSGPSTSTEILGSYPVGETTEVYEERDGFFRVEYDGQTGWIAVDYVHLAIAEVSGISDDLNLQNEDEEIADASDEIEKEPVLKQVTVSPNTLGTLRVRAGPSTSTDILGMLLVGTTVDVYEEVDGFFRFSYLDQTGWIAVDYVHLAGTEAPTHHLDRSILGDVDVRSKQAFLDEYWEYVDSKDKELIDLCKKYFDEIDVIAKQHDFPVELIIATWYREHTCKFKNPSNGWGNFQIITEYYPPGPISWAQFESQVVDFINFSREKWKYYDAIQVFGPEPVTISYNSFDLLSLRKQAILYNGITGTPETNVYANQNFGGVRVGGADGIIAAFLKALKYGLEK